MGGCAQDVDEAGLDKGNERADSVEGDADVCRAIQKALEEAERVATGVGRYQVQEVGNEAYGPQACNRSSARRATGRWHDLGGLKGGGADVSLHEGVGEPVRRGKAGSFFVSI